MLLYWTIQKFLFLKFVYNTTQTR